MVAVYPKLINCYYLNLYRLENDLKLTASIPPKNISNMSKLMSELDKLEFVHKALIKALRSCGVCFKHSSMKLKIISYANTMGYDR